MKCVRLHGVSGLSFRYFHLRRSHACLSHIRRGPAVGGGGDSLDSREQQRVAKALRKALGEDVEVSSPPPLLRSELKVRMCLLCVQYFAAGITRRVLCSFVCAVVPTTGDDSRVNIMSETGAREGYVSMFAVQLTICSSKCVCA